MKLHDGKEVQREKDGGLGWSGGLMKLHLAGCYMKSVFAQMGSTGEEPGVEVPGEVGKAEMMRPGLCICLHCLREG